MFVITHVLKFKYLPSHLKVKVSRKLMSFKMASKVDIFVINHCLEVMFQERFLQKCFKVSQFQWSSTSLHALNGAALPRRIVVYNFQTVMVSEPVVI